MNQTFIARTEININASPSEIWDALINPKKIKQYMFGSTVISDWKEGSSIIWTGEWKGKPYEDKGKILKMNPEREIQFTHFSPLTRDPDVPESYHTVTIEITPKDNQSHVSLSQDNNKTDEERQHSEKNWNMVLESLKKLLEG